MKYIEITLKIVAVPIVVLEVYSIACDLFCMPDWARWIGIMFAVLGVVAFTDCKCGRRFSGGSIWRGIYRISQESQSIHWS